VLERDWEAALRVKPSIGNDGDVVVGRDRLVHWNSESNGVLILCVALAQNELIMEEDDFAIDVFNQDPKDLRFPVEIIFPSEVGRNREINSK
jgi:hypothetical protein